MSSSSPLKGLGVILPVLGLLGALLTAPRYARANSGNNFLETIGLSIAVGTVLGASTLPFYDSPGSHVSNLAYGASAGAVVGVGVWLVGLFQGNPQRYDDSLNQTVRPTLSWFGTTRHSRNGKAFFANSTFEGLRTTQNVSNSIRPASVLVPLVSLTW